MLFGLALFLGLGGGYAVLRELFFSAAVFRPGWAVVGSAVFLSAFLCLALGVELVRGREIFFSMTPDRISYRLALLNGAYEIAWHEVLAVEITAYRVRFILHAGRKVTLRLGHIQDAQVALHVARSIQLAALEKKIVVNGVVPASAELVTSG